MGDQDMATFDDADWSEDSDRYPDYSHASFVYKLRLQILPNAEENREGFDNGTDFRIGDPNVVYREENLVQNKLEPTLA